MTTQYKINEATVLPNGSIMISGSVISGPRLVTGQEGTAASSKHNIRVVVVGTGVMDPNIAPRDRQGILVNLLEGNVELLTESLKGLVFVFRELNQTAI
jgi:hypothetical protein